jgi:lysine biosynthesis protein LysW
LLEKIEMPSTVCPLCKERVFVDASKEMGEIILCEDCDSKLELVGMDPIELDPASEDVDELEDGFNIYDNDDI